MFPRRHLALAAIMLVALVLRLGWIEVHPVTPDRLAAMPDQLEYLQLGTNLHDGHGLEFVDPRFGQQVWAFRTPGYPFFVALCHSNVAAIGLVQAYIDSLTVWAVYLIASTWLRPLPSLIAALFYAVNPLAIFFTELVLTETIFTAMLVWGSWLLIRRGLLPVLGAAVLSAAVLVRPSALALPVLMAITARGRKCLPLAVTAAALTFAAVFPWAWRNHNLLGQWVWTSTNSGITRYDGFHPGADGGSDQGFVHHMPELMHMNELERSAYLSDLAGQYIRANPGHVVELTFLKVIRFWSPVPVGRQFDQPLYLTGGLAYSLPLLLQALLGLMTPAPAPQERSGPGFRWFLLSPALYLTIIHAGSVSSLRYRLPAEPLLAILAVNWWRRRKPADVQSEHST